MADKCPTDDISAIPHLPRRIAASSLSFVHCWLTKHFRLDSLRRCLRLVLPCVTPGLENTASYYSSLVLLYHTDRRKICTAVVTSCCHLSLDAERNCRSVAKNKFKKKEGRGDCELCRC